MAADGEPALPDGWEAHVDEETGQTYFWNTETGTSSWTNPALQDSSLPFGWEQLEDDEGNTYYFNHESGDSQWHKPTGTDPELKSLNANLPDGWEALRDDEENRVYYFNFTTEESSWERPAAAGPPAPVEDASVDAAAETAAAATKGLVLPDRKAARRHSVAKALLMQGAKRAPRMLLPMAALPEDETADGDAGGDAAALPSATAGTAKGRSASRKASMIAKEDAGTASAVKLWLKVSDNGSFWRRRFCVLNPTARAIFVYLSDKTKSKKGTVDLVDTSVSEELPEDVKKSAPTEYVFSVKEPERGADPEKTTYFSASTVSACAQLLGAMAPIAADISAPSLGGQPAEVTPVPPKKGPPAVGARRTSANLS